MNHITMMHALVSKTKRPLLVSLICIFGLIGIILSLYWASTGYSELNELWFFYYNLAAGIIGLVFLLGIWDMRKWGANGYVVLALLNIVVLVFSNNDFLFSVISAAIIIFVLLGNYSKMK